MFGFFVCVSNDGCTLWIPTFVGMTWERGDPHLVMPVQTGIHLDCSAALNGKYSYY